MMHRDRFNWSALWNRDRALRHHFVFTASPKLRHHVVFTSGTKMRHQLVFTGNAHLRLADLVC
jgi:hypothetical protein